MSMTRRTILQTLPVAAALSMMPRGVAAAQHKAIVIGGGFAGSTAAKYLRMWSGGAIDVTLVEPKAKHISCVMSNLVLNEQLNISDLAFGYDTLQSQYGVNVVQGQAVNINGPRKRVKIQNGGWLRYDSLVVAAGIQFDRIPGLNSSLVPHAWIAGGQTTLLRNQIRAMPDNGTFVMTIPLAPYRCPPGPYERACVVADILGRRSGVLDGQTPPGGPPRVIVLDANPDIQAERETFSRAYSELYGEIVEYIPDAQVISVDSSTRTVTTSKGTYSGDVLNVIPRHSAPQLLGRSGLTGGARWAPVDPVTYASTLADFPDVHVIGDSQDTGQPKSGHMASSEAKVCADAIVRISTGLSAYTDERLDNLTTNSACFSPITFDQASWLTAVYGYDRVSGNMSLVSESLGEAHDWNRENYRDMFDWSDNLFADTFK